MRKLILFMHMPLDGYVAAANETAPLGSAGDDGALDTVVPQLTKDADTLLLGRVMADELLGAVVSPRLIGVSTLSSRLEERRSSL